MTTGFIVLAGGKSTRMNFPKHELMINNQRMIDYIVSKANEITNKVYISANSTINDYKITYDQRQNIGPIEGIYQCMHYSDCDYYCVMPCDKPMIPISVYRSMLENIKEYDCILLRNGGKVEPLVAVFKKSVEKIIKERIENGLYSMTELCEQLSCTYYNTDLTLLNIKTQEDYQLLLNQFEQNK
ncbi:MAG: molybdenum cofactor guanylyltransferase [Coprobacillus sp.]